MMKQMNQRYPAACLLLSLVFLFGCGDSKAPTDVSNSPPEGTISLNALNASADSVEITVSVTAWDEESNAVHILCGSFDTSANHHFEYPFNGADPYLDTQNQLTATRTAYRPAAADTFYVVRCSLTASDDLQSPGGHFQSTTLLDSVLVSRVGS